MIKPLAFTALVLAMLAGRAAAQDGAPQLRDRVDAQLQPMQPTEFGRNSIPRPQTGSQERPGPRGDVPLPRMRPPMPPLPRLRPSGGGR
jgi:hypothetical protein